VYLQPNDGSSLFAQDATFCTQSGLGGTGISFGSVNFPDRYIRHYNNSVYIANSTGTNVFDSATSWTNDVSWASASPWTP
jgi:hypothetical protein